jgi:hypothetical protein
VTSASKAWHRPKKKVAKFMGKGESLTGSGTVGVELNYEALLGMVEQTTLKREPFFHYFANTQTVREIF